MTLSADRPNLFYLDSAVARDVAVQIGGTARLASSRGGLRSVK
jgi:hypothetical protein